MKILKGRVVTLTLIIACTLCMTFDVAPVLKAEMMQDDPLIGPRYSVDSVGTYFEITGSTYLNIALTSTETIHAILESVPKMISVIVESVDTATSTTLTFAGLTPNALYYRYQDGFFVESITADGNGRFTYSQNISQRHHIVIRENHSTLYIDSDYTFTFDIYEPVVIIADNIVIDGNGYTVQGFAYDAGLELYERNNVTIKNLVVKGFWAGIHLLFSDRNTILNISATSNQFGIFLEYSNNNELIQNTAVNNVFWGIQLTASSNNLLKHNIASGNCPSYWRGGGIGVGAWTLTWPASNNTLLSNVASNNRWDMLLSYTNGRCILKDNNMTGNRTFGISGGDNELLDFIHDIDTSNTVNGKPIYYWVNQKNRQIPTDAGYVGIVNSTNIVVKDLTLTNNTHGLMFAYTTNSCIQDTAVSDNVGGIYFVGACANTISGNVISGNTNWGIYIKQGSNDNVINNNVISNNGAGIIFSTGTYSWLGHPVRNLVHNNNLVSNTVQAQDFSPAENEWHHPTLLEGNYWSDYPGADDGSGTAKHAIAGDGIGDTVIPWPGPDYDYYPLMSPWAVVADINISPERLNLMSNGEWITACITLPESYSIEDINVATVKLTCNDFVSPTEWLNTEGGVLMVKCDRIALRDYLGEIDLYDGERFYDVTLKVSGTLTVGTPFSGTDMITVIKR